jgi:hypothetical protein
MCRIRDVPHPRCAASAMCRFRDLGGFWREAPARTVSVGVNVLRCARHHARQRTARAR